MNTKFKTILLEAFNTKFQNIQTIISIITDYFGEDKVDVQKFYTKAHYRQAILDSQTAKDIEEFTSLITKRIQDLRLEPQIIVHFPEVTVTNENGKFIKIYDLFAQIKLTSSGVLYSQFRLLKSTFTSTQYQSGYCHSHMYRLEANKMPFWVPPCLGRGPIKATQESLIVDFNEDLWRLFCVELDNYVKIESLDGGPYIKLETVSATSKKNVLPISSDLKNIARRVAFNDSVIVGDLAPFIRDFISYLVAQRFFKFSYNGQFVIRNSGIDLYIQMSNALIEWYNSSCPDVYKEMIANNILKAGVYKNGAVYPLTQVHINQNYTTTPLLIFKNTPITLKIMQVLEVEEELNQSLFIDPSIFHRITFETLYLINYYGTSQILHGARLLL